MEKKRTYGVWAVRSSTSIFGPAQSWCKENGKPLEFDTKAAAENYAKEANEHTTANVRYYVKEKEPEPGAVRKGTSQPELDARSHEEVIPRNDAAEKQNEIPGRQIPSQTDPLVEIRSAVHSNYAGMVAMLGADNRVYLGREERCHYQNMQPSYYDNQDGSLCFVCDQPDMYYFLYGEGWAHTQAEMLERGLTLRQYEEFARLQNGVLAQFTTQREILFAGKGTLMAGVRFEDVDLLGALSRIVDLHTQHYKEDFDLDKELISKLAVSERSEDKQLLWMSRPCGTYTLREREVYLEGSHENKVWRFYQEQTNDPVLAYAISLKEVRDGKIFGDLYPLNYREHVERMKKLTCPIGNVAVAFEDGNVITIPYQERRQFMNRLMPEHGAPKTMTYLPENEPELMIILKRERLKRSYHATAGNLEEYLDKLEKTTLREKLKRAKTAVSTQEVSSHKRGLER